MNKRLSIVTIILMAIPVLLLGCSSKTPASPTNNPNLIYTAAAQTADARLTQIFKSTPSSTPVTPSPTFNFVQTMAAQTASALLTQSAALTPSPRVTTSTTPTPPSVGGDKAAFVADVTIPDKTVIAPGAGFTKTWRLQNNGTTTWTTSYLLAFIGGEQMGTITSVPISQSVSPGAQIDISVNMVAPTSTGSYQGNWKMRNASGLYFNDPVYVLITVGSGGTAQPTSSGAPSATPTSTGIPTNPITSLTMSVDNSSANGCPHTFLFTAWVTLNQKATLSYRLEAGGSYEFDLPDPQTGTYDAGTFPVTFEMTFTSAGEGWLSFHVTSPVDMSSNQASFTLTCSP